MADVGGAGGLVALDVGNHARDGKAQRTRLLPEMLNATQRALERGEALDQLKDWFLRKLGRPR